MNKLISILVLSILLSTGHSQQKKNSTKNFVLDTVEINTINTFIEGMKEKSIGNSLEALKHFNYTIERDPKNDAAFYEASKIDAELNSFSAALSKAEKAYELNSDNTYYLKHYTELLTRTGNIEKAIGVLRQVVKSKKASPIHKLQYAYLLGMSKNPKKAIAIFNEMEKTGEFNDAIAYEKIKLYVAINDVKGAENELKKLVKKNPENTHHLGNLADFYLKSGNIDEAERAFNDILRIEPNNVNALLYKAQYYQVKDDTENYRSTILSLLENKELNFDTKITVIADRFANNTKVDSSDKIFLNTIGSILVSQYPDEYRSYQVLGDMHYIAGNYDSARIAYCKSLSMDSKEYNVWQNFFFSLNILKKYKELADSTKSALEYFPANSIIHYYNGIANAQIENLSQAEKSYRRGLRFVGENRLLEAQIYTSLADMYYRQKRYKEMDESFESSIRLDPDNAYTLNNYAYYLSQRNDKLDYAKKMSRKSLDIDKDNASFLDTYAWIQFMLGDYTKAKYYQEQALKHGKEDMATIYEHYGDILIKLNDKENALKYWNKAKEVGSKNKSLPIKISTMSYVEYQE